MKSIDFLHANIALAKDQPQYQTLYARLDRYNPSHDVTCCLELTKEEIEAICRTGKLWITQSTFGSGFCPIRVDVLSPFVEDTEGLLPPMDDNRVTEETWNNTHFQPYDETLTSQDKAYYQVPCKNCSKPEFEHYWSTRQCELE